MNKKKLPRAVTQTADEMRKAGAIAPGSPASNDDSHLSIERRKADAPKKRTTLPEIIDPPVASIAPPAPAASNDRTPPFAGQRDCRTLCESRGAWRCHSSTVDQRCRRCRDHSAHGEAAVRIVWRALRARPSASVGGKPRRGRRSDHGRDRDLIDACLFHSRRQFAGSCGIVGDGLSMRTRCRPPLRPALRQRGLIDRLSGHRPALKFPLPASQPH